MEELPKDAESVLKKLIAAYKADKDVHDFIYKWLKADSSQKLSQSLHLLVDAGYLTGNPVSERSTSYRFGNLTPAGRCYFRSKRRIIVRIWGPTIASALLGVGGSLGGVALGWWLNSLS